MPRRSSDMKRRVPRVTTDQEAEAFLESDLSDLDFSQFKSGRVRLDQGSDSVRGTCPPGMARPQPSVSQHLGSRTRKTGKRVTARGRAAQAEAPSPSETYRLFEQAMVER